MAVFFDLKGTTQQLFQIGKGGPKFKNASGILEARNAGDSAYVDLTAAILKAASDSIELNSDAAGSGADWKMTLARPASGMTQNLTLTLPANYGSSGQFLSTDGAGALTWASAGGGGSGFTELTGPVNLSGTYNGFLRVIGDATVTGNLTVKGDLKVTGTLYNQSTHSATIEGNAVLGNYNFSPSIGSDGGSLVVGGNLTTDYGYAAAVNSSTLSQIYSQDVIAGLMGYTSSFGLSFQTSEFTDTFFDSDTSNTTSVAGDWTAYIAVNDFLYIYSVFSVSSKIQITSVSYDSLLDTTDISFNYIYKFATAMGNTFTYSFVPFIEKNPSLGSYTTTTTILPDDTIQILSSQNFATDSFMAGLTTLYDENGNTYTVTASYNFSNGTYDIVSTTSFTTGIAYFFEDYTLQSFTNYMLPNGVDGIDGITTLYSLYSATESIYFLSGPLIGTSISITGITLIPTYGSVIGQLATPVSYVAGMVYSSLTPFTAGTVGGNYQNIASFPSTSFGTYPTALFAYNGPSKGNLRTVNRAFLTNTFIVNSNWSSIPSTRVLGEINDASIYASGIQVNTAGVYEGARITMGALSNNPGVQRTVTSANFYGIYSGLVFDSPLPNPEYANSDFAYENASGDELRLNQGTSGSVTVSGNYYLKGFNGSGVSGYDAVGSSVTVKGNLIGTASSYERPANSRDIGVFTTKAVIEINASGSTTSKAGGTLNVSGDILNIGYLALKGNDAPGVGGSLTCSNLECDSIECTGYSNLVTPPALKGDGGTIIVNGDLLSNGIYADSAEGLGNYGSFKVYGNLLAGKSYISVYAFNFNNTNLTVYGDLTLDAASYTFALKFTTSATYLSGVPSRLYVAGDLTTAVTLLGDTNKPVNFLVDGVIKIKFDSDVLYFPSFTAHLRSSTKLTICSSFSASNAPILNLYGYDSQYQISLIGMLYQLNFTQPSNSSSPTVYVNGGVITNNCSFAYYNAFNPTYCYFDGVKINGVMTIQNYACTLSHTAGFTNCSLSSLACSVPAGAGAGSVASGVLLNNTTVSNSLSVTDNAGITATTDIVIMGSASVGTMTMTNRADMNIKANSGGTNAVPACLTIARFGAGSKTTLKNNSGTQTASISAHLSDSIFYIANSDSFSVWKRIQGSNI